MTSNHKMFHDYKLTIGNEKVIIVYGTKVPIARHGSIFLNKYFAHDVLHIPDLSLNLLYIARIIKDLNYELIFSIDKCMLQDLATKKMIGIDLFGDGLYKLLSTIASALALGLQHNKINQGYIHLIQET